MICSPALARFPLRCSMQQLLGKHRVPKPAAALAAVASGQGETVTPKRHRVTTASRGVSGHAAVAVQASHLHLSAPCLLACTDTHFTEAEYENIVGETLDSLAEYLEELPDLAVCHADFDIMFGDGVLTLKLGGSLGTYVINKQTPNKQIWLSSPTSGPKRYDFRDGHWVYTREQEGLHTLLERELSAALKAEVTLAQCAFYS